MAGFRNSYPTGAGIGSGFGEDLFWEELVLGSQNNTPDETNGVNNAVSCYNEAVRFSASFITSLFGVDEICGMTMDFVFLSPL